ncbi:MAG: hypothetical protein ACXAC8_19705 [Candidatus Hodarchaeales archaeon]|jgi:hypothetical protein
MNNSDLIEYTSKIVKIIGLIFVSFTVLSVVSQLIPPSKTASLEMEVTTEDNLPVNYTWIEFPKDKYKMDISVNFRPYTLDLGERDYSSVDAQGNNTVNLSVIANNSVVTSWGWSDWVNEGDYSMEFTITSDEIITLRFEFILEELNNQFEANWKITVTEVDGLKNLASGFREGFWIFLIIGGLSLLIGFKGLDRYIQ